MTAENVQIPNEFNDEEDWWPHKICKTYEANRLGVVRNIETKNVVGYEMKNGYCKFTCCCCRENGKSKKNYYIHRFIWECYNGIIKDDKVIDHLNNIKSDNRLENLQMITQSENCRKNHSRGKSQPRIKVKAINVETGETFIYKSIYGAGKDLHIERGNICKILNGLQHTAKSKKYNERYFFQKIDKDSDNKSTVIIIKNKINLPIQHVKKMIVNNSS